MSPSPTPSPDHLALRSIVVGSLLAVAWYHGQGHTWGESAALLTWSQAVESDGATALQLLPQRCLISLGLVFVAMLISACVGLVLAFFIVRHRVTRWLSAPITLLAQLLAALPVMGIAWCGVAWLVNVAHLPIESLIPYIPPPERDSQGLALGRALWSWIVPAWVLVLPLTGLWLATGLDRLRTLQPLKFQLGLEAKGLPESQITQSHWFRLAWATLQQRWQLIGMIAFAWGLFVEDALGLPGWGGFAARCVRDKNMIGVASALVAAAWLSACWHLISWPLRAGTDKQAALSADPPSYQSRGAWWSAITLVAVLALIFGLALAGGWVNDLLLPWVTSALTPDHAKQAATLWPQLINDAYAAGIAVCLATVITVTFGWFLALAARVKALPRTKIIDTLLNGPFTAVMLLFAMTDTNSTVWFWPAIALGAQGAARLRDACAHIRVSPHMLASRVSGTGLVARWCRHAVPELGYELSAWAMHSLGTALLWIVLIRSLVPASVASLGNALADARSTAITNSAMVLHPTWLTAVAVLCFWRLSRVLRAAPH